VRLALQQALRIELAHDAVHRGLRHAEQRRQFRHGKGARHRRNCLEYGEDFWGSTGWRFLPRQQHDIERRSPDLMGYCRLRLRFLGSCHENYQKPE
jgi:hypothetical protein